MFFKASILSALMLSALSFGANPTTTKIVWNCGDTTACPAVTGPYGFAWAQIGDLRFAARDTRSQSTCCQLAGKIHKDICDAGEEAQGVEVTCE